MKTKKSTSSKRVSKRKAFVLNPGDGRHYDMGRIHSIFKADGAETANTFSVSEWWLDPHTTGPGHHHHEEDHAYYVLEGTMSIAIEGKWKDCIKGSFVLIPGGTKHNFENRSSSRAGILSFNNQAGFEEDLPAIVDWFKENPPGDA
jgi:quercetin dioxygenase-like cupin family protein